MDHLLKCQSVVWLFVFCCLAGIAGANPLGEPEIRADLEYLYQNLQASHSNLFAHVSQDAYDAAYRKAMESIDGSMDHLDVVKLFMKFVAFGKVGHSRIDFPIAEYIPYVMGEGTLFPLDLRTQGEQVFALRSYTDLIQPGMEIVSLNGQPIFRWVERLGGFVSAERPYMKHAFLEDYFSRLFWLDQGRVDTFQIGIRNEKGDLDILQVPASMALEMEQQKGARENDLHTRKMEILPGGIAYLRPGPFYQTGQDDDLASFENFLDSAFRSFIESDCGDLILDLRNNPGGDNSFSDPMISWFADQPFRFASSFMVKTSDTTRKVLSEGAQEDPGGILSKMLEEMKQYPDGAEFPFEIPMAKPRFNERFSGRIWALINRQSYSNATTVAAIIQDYGLGLLVGEETSDLPTSYASSAQFPLPNTGFVVTYPKAYFIRPNGSTAVAGVVPDHCLSNSIVIEDSDAVLTQTVQLILSDALPVPE